MTMPQTELAVVCPECGTENAPGKARCWLCGASLVRSSASSQPVNPFASPRAIAAEPLSVSASMGLMVVALVIVGVGLFSVAPGLLVPYAVLGAPALLRTVAATKLPLPGGQQMSFFDKMAAFGASLGLMILIQVAGMIAFFFACLAALGIGAAAESSLPLQSETAFIALFAIAGLASVGVMAWLYIRMWPRAK